MKILVGVLILISLSGCALFDEKIVIQRELVYTKVVCPDQLPPRRIVTKPIDPIAITDEMGLVWVGLSGVHYGHLAINTEEAIRYITDTRNVVRYYRTCVIDFNLNVERLRNEQEKKEE